MEYHPDRNDGCEIKAKTFKEASDAYSTLSDTNKRNVYDREINNRPNYQYGYVNYTKQTVDQRTAHYRKVYAPRPPPGFKIFDHERHHSMHYGDGIMDEEIERMRIRAQKAGSFSLDYESPLGKGFSLHKNSDSDPYSKENYRKQWVKGSKKKKIGGIEFKTAYMDNDIMNEARKNMQAKETILERMKMRREHRLKRPKNQPNHATGPGSSLKTKVPEDEGCIFM